MAIPPFIDLHWSAETNWSKMLSLSVGRESVRLRQPVAAFVHNQDLKDKSQNVPAQSLELLLFFCGYNMN